MKRCILFYSQLLLLYSPFFTTSPAVIFWADACANLHNSCDGSVFIFFCLFTIFMRAAKGPVHATIWEQPLTLGVGPMGASHISLFVVGMRAGRSITAGLATVWLVELYAPVLQGGLSNSTSAWETPAAQMYFAAAHVLCCFDVKVLHCYCLASERRETILHH